MSRNEASVPDPEVVPTAERRRFTTQEKLRILEEADACTEPGELGALLRREGIYSSYLSRWRRARDRGQLQALRSKKRGRKPPTDKELTEEAAKLQRENERLQARLAQAEAIIEAQKNSQKCLGWLPGRTGTTNNND
jgi:transposase-like protein